MLPRSSTTRSGNCGRLDGEDPAGWPNAAIVLEHAGGPAELVPALTGPDPCDELDGIGARVGRYRADLAADRYRLAPDWADPITTET